MVRTTNAVLTIDPLLLTRGRVFRSWGYMIHVMITGLRDMAPTAEALIEATLAKVVDRPEPIEIRFGGARGVDTCALILAARLAPDCDRVVYCPGVIADLQEEARAALIYATKVIELGAARGKAAFLQRNLSMLAGADVVIAFTDGRDHGGTAHAITYARLRRVPVEVVMIPSLHRTAWENHRDRY